MTHTAILIIMIVALFSLTATLLYLTRQHRDFIKETARRGVPQYDLAVLDLGDPNDVDTAIPAFQWPDPVIIAEVLDDEEAERQERLALRKAALERLANEH